MDETRNHPKSKSGQTASSSGKSIAVGAERRLNGLFAAFWLIGTTATFAVASFYPIEGAYATESGRIIQGWAGIGAMHTFPVVFAALVLLGLLAWLQTGRLLDGTGPGCGTWLAALQGLRPLAFLPLLVAMRHSSAWIGVVVAAMALPIGTSLILALCMERLTRPLFEPASLVQQPFARNPTKPALVFCLAALTLVTVYFWQGKGRFLGGGDVCHYQTQLDNLVECGNLDLTDRVEGWMDASCVPPGNREQYVRYSHMRRNARGRIYSVHAYGWPLLAWPFTLLLGDAGVILLSVLVGALALTGVYACCLQCKTSAHSSLLATSALGLAWFWNYTVFSRLPEMLGCTLCIWAFWAIVAEKGKAHGLLPTAVATACCTYLPFAHMRFFPLAAVLLIEFCAAALTPSPIVSNERHKRFHAARPVICALVAILGWGVLWRAHRTMFAGVSSFTLSNIFFSHPIGMLGIFTDRRGAGPIFPLIWLLGLAPIFALCKRQSPLRFPAACALAIETTSLIACCANDGALIGSCVSARYFLQAIPPLIPFGAVYLDCCGRMGRRWWFLLAVIPILYLLVISPSCSGSGLVLSPYGLWDFDAFRSFWMPFRATFSPLPPSRSAICLILPLCLMTTPWILVSKASSAMRLAAASAVLGIGVLAGIVADSFLPGVGGNPASAFGNHHHWHHFRRIAGPEPKTFPETFSPDEVEPESDKSGTERDIVLTTRPVYDKKVRKVPVGNLQANDWRGRHLHWVRIKKITTKAYRPGAHAIRIRGEVRSGTALLSAVVDKRSLLTNDVSVGSGSFDVFLLVPHQQEPLAVVATMTRDGDEGETVIHEVDVYPWTDGLDEAAGPFPPGSVVCNAVKKRRRRTAR